jgi:hypothetical protein
MFLVYSPPTLRGVAARKTPPPTLARLYFISLQHEKKKKEGGDVTDLQVFFKMGGKGPHAIFLPLQNKQARGFFSTMFLDSEDRERNSVVGGDGGRGVTGDASDGLRCGWLSCGESKSLRSDNRSRRMTPSWQMLANFNVGGFILRSSCRKLYVGVSGWQSLTVSWMSVLTCGDIFDGWSTRSRYVGSRAGTGLGWD